MVPRFEFATATRIVFGAGTFHELPALAAELAGGAERAKALVVSGRSNAHTGLLLERMTNEAVDCELLRVEGEPTVGLVQAGRQQAALSRRTLVIGIGGGSAIDAAKAIAALATNPGDPIDYLEVIGRNRPLAQPPLPLIAVPTTAGTGAEVTRNAVLASPEHRVKVSLRSPLMLPAVALVDPELTHDVPPAITATTGLDALTQLIEPFVSARANPLADGLCREGITRAARSLLRAYRNGNDADARADMAIASLFGGLALANAGLGAVHGFAGPIGGMFPAPHGAVCAALLPHVMAANLRALQQRSPDSAAMARYHEIGRLVTGSTAATAADGVRWVERLREALDVPPLGRYGIREGDLPLIVEKALAASSMKANPIALTQDELLEVLREAM